MALSDFNASINFPGEAEALLEEAWTAHIQNGTLQQQDWWKICANASMHNYTPVHGDDTVGYLIEADLDTRHVAILCAPDAHLDPYEISMILKAAPVDGSTILAAYLYAMTDILEGHYAKACKIRNFHPFIKDGQADWTYIESDYHEYMSLLAGLWETSEQEFVFDAGRKQILYAALETELVAHGIKPDWFLPSTAFLPFEGRQPKTDLIVCDLQIYKVAEIAWRWHIKTPEKPQEPASGPKGLRAMIQKLLKR